MRRARIRSAIATSAIAMLFAGLYAGAAPARLGLPPDLQGKLIGAGSLGRCLRSAHPSKAWQLYRLVKPRPAEVPADLLVGAWKPSWGPGPPGRPQGTKYVELNVFPNEAAATEFRKRFDYSMAGEIVNQLHRWGNLVLWSQGEFPTRIGRALRHCATSAARLPATPVGPFTSCADPAPTGSLKNLFIDRVAVRGGTCEEAYAILHRRYNRKEPFHCGPRITCFGENYCCGSFVDYIGNGRVDVVYGYEI